MGSSQTFDFSCADSSAPPDLTVEEFRALLDGDLISWVADSSRFGNIRINLDLIPENIRNNIQVRWWNEGDSYISNAEGFGCNGCGRGDLNSKWYNYSTGGSNGGGGYIAGDGRGLAIYILPPGLNLNYQLRYGESSAHEVYKSWRRPALQHDIVRDYDGSAVHRARIVADFSAAGLSSSVEDYRVDFNFGFFVQDTPPWTTHNPIDLPDTGFFEQIQGVLDGRYPTGYSLTIKYADGSVSSREVARLNTSSGRTLNNIPQITGVSATRTSAVIRYQGFPNLSEAWISAGNHSHPNPNAPNAIGQTHRWVDTNNATIHANFVGAAGDYTAFIRDPHQPWKTTYFRFTVE